MPYHCRAIGSRHSDGSATGRGRRDRRRRRRGARPVGRSALRRLVEDGVSLRPLDHCTPPRLGSIVRNVRPLSEAPPTDLGRSTAFAALSIRSFEGMPKRRVRYRFSIVASCGSISCKHAVRCGLNVLFRRPPSFTVLETTTREASPAEGRFVQTALPESCRVHRIYLPAGTVERSGHLSQTCAVSLGVIPLKIGRAATALGQVGFGKGRGR